MKFDWNPDKAAADVQKRDGVTAALPHHRRILPAAGASGQRLLFMVNTELEVGVIWILSTRGRRTRKGKVL